MHARSLTVLGDPRALDAGIGHIRDEVMPAVRELPGYVGLSMLVDRSSGRSTVISAWRDEPSGRAAAAALRAVHGRAAAVLGGPPEDEQWSIAVLHRDRAAPAPACVRATWLRINPGHADHVVDVYRLALLPQIREFEGFCGAGLLVDRESGYGVSMVGFAGHEAMRRTRNLAAVVRERGAREVDAEVVEVGEFELALAHLRAPEPA